MNTTAAAPRTISGHHDITIRADNARNDDDYVSATLESLNDGDDLPVVRGTLRILYAASGPEGDLESIEIPAEHLDDLISVLRRVRSQRDSMARPHRQRPARRANRSVTR